MTNEETLTVEVLASIEEFLAEAYPYEGCGIIVETPDGKVRVHFSENLTEEMRKERPDYYTRGAEDGYVLDGRIIVGAEKRGEALRVIFHSHPDVGAYFSEEDARKALVDWGDGPEPAFPGVDYLVTAVDDGVPSESKLFRFNAADGEFVEVACYAAVLR